MSKAKKKLSFPSFPTFIRASDRDPLLFSIFFSIAIVVAGVLAVFGVRIAREASELSRADDSFGLKARSMVSQYPIARMMPDILSQDRRVATYLIAIAKKESNWGRRAPLNHGESCFNYWGYRGSESPTDSGYSCFSSRAEAVRIVGRRVRELLDQGIDVPREFIVWKRGFLDRPLDPSEEKWISDVSYYVKNLEEWPGGRVGGVD